MINDILSIGTKFLNGPIIPAAISLVGIGCFYVLYRKENKRINSERKQVQQDLINKATIAFPRRAYDVVCAGSKDYSACEKIETIDVKVCNFLDSNNKPIDVDLYNVFIVHGESMQYAGIKDEDLLFTPVDFKLSQLESDSISPQILILKYRKSEHESPKLKANYKVRRFWLKCSINDIANNYATILKNIIDSESFSKLKRENGYKGEHWMINTDFPNRLNDYSKYSSDGKYPDEFKEVIISTTYDVLNNEIHFSIHPQSSIIGIVAHSYTLNK